ncbi:autotransporter outer membrane beta-barrel domain-containing protein [Caulobacter sp. 602-2]|uniref:Autotransporter outer membrane beta-barrel domain-containing protein n=1 Tax=Caulobacter sp. 602-2 TaxID=2710887 RepID=A0A6G4QZZ0_9CAUL|nr:autotransporter-associated beta strand repeat-containing protein [Caulobacter sp. 602-2]NGM51102.1 autotransporter outer membrane beta-barrel domain-containing protein [Caulobacter sp. 602-2]
MSRRRRLGAAASSVALLTALSMAGAMVPGVALADGGSSNRVVAGAGPGGAGGVDGDAASATGKDGSAGTTGAGSGGGGGGVNLQTGFGAHGGSEGASVNGTMGTAYGATGAMGAAIDTAQTITTTITGGTGGLGADPVGTSGQADHVSASGHGGGGVGVSATADVIVGAGGLIQGGTGGGASLGLVTGRGGGGGGVGLFTNSDVTILSGGSVIGGIGGASNAGGGGGGAAAIVLTAPGAVVNGGVVTGGRGGVGTPSNFSGEGGAGVLVLNGGAVTNLAGGTLTGGNAGTGWPTFLGAPGSAVEGANITLVNAGALVGGTRTGGFRANAVTFTGGVNSLEIWSSSVITGNVQAYSAADRLILGGATDASFDVTQIGAAAKYRGFGGFEKAGAATWTLTGTNTGVTPWTLREGLLRITADAALGDAAGALTFAGGGLDTTGSFAIARDIVAASTGRLIIATATDTITLDGDITGTGSLTKEGLGTLVLTGDNGAFTGVITNQTGVLRIGGATAGDLGADIVNDDLLRISNAGDITLSGDISGTGDLVKDGSGRTILTGTSTHAGLTTVSDGVLQIGAGGAAGGFSGDIVNNATLATDHTGDLLLSGDISGVGAFGKFGAGRTILAGALTYAGGTTIDAGTLQLGDGGAAVGLMGDVANNGVLATNHTGDLTLAGVISGAGGFQKLGSGRTILTGVNTFSGAIRVDAGTLQLGAGGAAGGLSGDIVNDGVLATNHTGDLTLAGDISGTGAFVKQGAGRTILTGDLGYSGLTTISAGVLQLGAGALVSDFAGDIVNSGALWSSHDGVQVLSGDISGMGAFYKYGSGRTVLTGTNSYRGSTFVEAGTLVVNAGRTGLGAALTAVRSGATLAGNGVVGGQVIVQAGGTLAPGDGAGTLTINAGLLLQNGSFLSYELGQANLPGGAFNDLVVVNGNLTLDGTLNVAVAPGGGFDPGLYRIISYTGALTNNGLDIGTIPTPEFFVQASLAGQVNLVNSAGLSFRFWDGASGVRNNGWVDGGVGLWQRSSGNDNWVDEGNVPNGTYEDGAFAVFGATAGRVTVDASLGAVETAGMQFVSDGYVIGGDALTLTGPEAFIRVGDGTAAGAGLTATIEAGLAGSARLVKSDLGVLVLSGPNSYTGGTTLRGGEVRIGSSAALGATSGVLVFDGGRLTATADLSLGHDLSLLKDGQISTGSGVNATLDGAIGGAGALVKDGAGTLVLAGDAAHTGGTRILAGSLRIGAGGATGGLSGDIVNDGQLVADRSGQLTLAGAISGSGGFVQAGQGVTVLTGTNTYVGATDVMAGTLLVNGDHGGATGATSVASGATLGGAGVIGGLVSLADGATLAAGGASGAAGTLTINGGLSLAGGSILDFQLGQAGVAGGALNDLVAVGGDLKLDGVLNVSTAGGGSFGTGVYRLFTYGGTLTDDGLTVGATPAGSKAYVQTGFAGQVNLINTGGLILNFWDGDTGTAFDGAISGGDGVWRFNAGANSWTEASGDLNAFYDQAAYAVFGGTSGVVSIDDAQGAITAAGLQFLASGYRLEGDALGLTGSTTEIRVGDGTAASAGMTATIASALTGSGRLVKADLGALILDGANSYAGGTTIAGGVLQVSADANLGAANGGLWLDGGALRTTASFASERTVTLDADGRIETVSGATLTLNGGVDGVGALIKDGAGRLIIAGEGTYAGGTTISGGALQIGDGGTTGAILGAVVNNGLLTFDRSDASTFAGPISGSGAVEIIGSGTTILTAANTHGGGTVIRSGTLQLGNGGASGSVAGAIANDGVLAIDRSDRLSLAGLISGAGGFAQNGSGVTVLTAANSYLGETWVNAGLLVVNGDQSAATGLTSVANGAALGGSGVIGGDVAVAAGGAIGPGNSPGTLTINGDLALAQGSALNFELGAAGVAGGPLNDLIVVGGDLALDGTLNVSVPTGGAFDAGVYRLISYSGALTDNGLDLGVLPSGANAYVHTGFAGQVNLVNTAGLTLNYWDGAAGPGFDGLVDGGDGTWRAAGGLSWTGDAGAINAGYANGAFAVFAGAAGVVTIDGGQGAVTASGLQFMTDGYRIEGDALTLTGAQASIRVGDGTAAGAGMTAAIASAIGGAGELVKTDLGTLVLTGANTYAGGTTLNAGGLYINGDQTAASGATRVNAGLLGGSGVIGGSVSVADGAILAPGGSAGAAGTLTINGGLTLSNGSILDFQLGQAGVAGGGLNDLLVVKGDLTLDGVLNVSQSAGGTFGAGVYRLVSYDGALTDNGLRIGATPASDPSYVQTSVAGQVNLVNTGGLVLNYWDGAGVGFDGAIAGGAGVWRAGGAELWTDAGGAINATYADGALAIFAGTAGTVRIDDAAGPVSAMGLQFATDGYRLEGGDLTLAGSQAAVRVGDGTAAGAGMTATIAADIVGAAGLAKTDLGVLVLSGTNTYEGGTAISDGVLQVASDANLGAASGGLSFDGGTLRTTATMETARATTFAGVGRLEVAERTTLSLKGAVFGAGGLVKSGAGTLVLAGDGSAYAGRASVTAGVLRVDGMLGGVTDVMNGGRLEGVGRLGGLVLRSGGVIAPGGEGFGVLTTAGDFAADGGLIEIDAVLGGDGSQADRLVVGGATSGAAEISVANRGGLGAQTQEGIKIVDVAGASNAQFTLRGDYVFQGDQAIIAGAYAYRLYKNGVAAPADGDWYLRSSLVDPGEPETPTQPETPEGPLYQPGAPVYEAYGASLLSQNGVSALRQRTGDRVWGQGATALGGAWGRIEGEQSRSENAPRSSTGADLKTDRWAVQMGYDRALPDQTWGGTLVLGASWRYGEADTKVRSVHGDGAIETNGYGFGATATWYGQGGAYVDLQAQASWYDSDLRSNLLGDLARGLDGSGESVGVEVGRTTALGGGLQLTPQFQTVYSKVRFDSFEDEAGAQVWGDRGESLRSRIAAALAREIEGEAGAGRFYGQMGLAYEWTGGPSVMVSGAQLARRDDRLWGELAFGGSYRWRQGLSVFGEASAASGLNSLGDAYSVRANMGLRLAF